MQAGYLGGLRRLASDQRYTVATIPRFEMTRLVAGDEQRFGTGR